MDNISKTIRTYIKNDNEIYQTIGENIFLLEKPPDKNPTEYIQFVYKPIGGGLIKNFSVEFNLIGKDLNILLSLKNRLIEILDDPRGEKKIGDSSFAIRISTLTSGGGMIKNNGTGNYHVILYFLIKI